MSQLVGKHLGEGRTGGEQACHRAFGHNGFKEDRITIAASDEPVLVYDLQNSHVSYGYPRGYT